MMHALQTAIESHGEYTCRAYSGRMMFGRNCLGVVVENGDIGNLIAHIVDNLDETTQGDIADGVRSMRTDSMGLQTIVYFPSVSYIDPDVFADDNCDDEGESAEE